MSAPSQAQSSSNPTNNVVDPLDLLDFSEYDSLPYQSPSVSPASSSKPQFTARQPSATPATMPSGQQMHGPSHRYDQYKQQTPFVPGALASTMAINQNTRHVGYTLDYNVSQGDDMFDFNAGPSQSSPNMDLDYESQQDPQFFFEQTINPNAIGGRDSLPSPPAVQSNIGRMYPGMHQAQALAKAQAQQRQQQQIIAQQQQRQQQMKQKGPAPPSDPMVEQKITQLLNSMRAKPNGADSMESPLLNLPKPKKDEDDMDEDERLLNSEEGKKLSSKERRQLRNKVSARAFRSRRKGKQPDRPNSNDLSATNIVTEYITQLEAEIASKVTENGDLRAQNRALMEENKRLSDLTRMLLSSSSFSTFLDHLSQSNGGAPQQHQPQPAQMEQRQSEQRQLPKDVNPYNAARQQQQQQQIGMVMLPEQSMDFSMLNIADSGEVYNYQPQVFAVLEIPEFPEIDIAKLSGKSSDVTETFEVTKKAEITLPEAPISLEVAKAQAPESPLAPVETEKTVADLDSDIFDDETSAPSTIMSVVDSLSTIVIQSDKASRYQLVDASVEEATSTRALVRVQKLSASIEATMAKLERLTMDL
jgi:bZIP-type transcription factor MBZ1